MKILWDKKLIKLSNGSYIAWGLKRKKFFFANKNELKLNCAIIEYYEEREKCNKKVISDLHKIIAELKKRNETVTRKANKAIADKLLITAKYNEVLNQENDKLQKENAELRELVEKYRQAVDKCLHITFVGGGCEVNTIGQYATLVDGYLTNVEGLAKWKN